MSSHSESPPKAQPAGPGTRMLGKYELQKQLGVGGMGAVYLAKDTQLKRLVALKVLPADKAKNPTLVRRFHSEAQAAAQMRHDHIVAVYENGEADGHLFIAMEYVDGADLYEWVRKRGKIPVKRSLEIIKQVATALQHANEHGIVHRDIKPSNLLIRHDGMVKLTDLGLARSVDDTLETDITRAGTTVGTVDYMSPEQGRNSKLADIRSDLYSLGCTWYHMLTGSPPYPDGSLTNKLQAHATLPIPNPRDLNDQIPEGVVAVIQRMMAKKPEDRYQTPAELLKDLASPGLTRGGVAEDVMTAINEDTNDTVVTKTPKRALPPGVLPPKKKAKVEDEEEKPSLLDWETLQPLLWGGGILSGIVALGMTVAYFSGGFDFTSGKITKLEDRPNAPTGDMVVKSPQSAPPGSNQRQGAPAEAGPTTVSSPEITPSPEGSESTSPPAEGDPNRTETLASPQNPYGGTTPDSTEPNGSVFNPEEIPDWTEAPSLADDADPQESPGSAAAPTANSVSGNGKSKSSPGAGSSSGPPKAAGSKTSSTTTPGGKVSANKSNPGGASAPRLQVLSLGQGLNAAARGPALTEALRNLSPEGAVIRLAGGDPYIITPTDLTKVKYLKLEAENATQPVILLRPASGQMSAGLRMTDGVLELEGIQFGADRSAFSGSDSLPMIESIDGQLLVRRCGFSVWGHGAASFRAVSVSSRQEAQQLPSQLPPRVLFDEVVSRGEDLTAMAITRSAADVVIKDSLLISGSKPVIELSGASMPISGKKPAADSSQRAVRIVQSTLSGRASIIQASSEGDHPPPTTSIVWQNSIAATPSAAEPSVLLDAKGWRTEGSAAKPQLMNLTWMMKDSAALGFQRLALLSQDQTISSQNPTGWQSLWNKPQSGQHFSTTVWPADVSGDASSVDISRFDRSSLPPVDISLSDGSPPGCEIAALAISSPALQPWLTALIAKPSFPVVSEPASPPSVVTLEISKQQDLGTMLQNGTWPPGTVLEVVGSGVKLMSPVRLVNKQWKLTWRVQEGAPLTLTPKFTSNEFPGLISVEGGQVEISNLRFQMPAVKKASIASIISATNSRLSLNTVWLQGVMTEDGTLQSLLDWKSGPLPSDDTLTCINSVFSGSETAMQLELGSVPAFLRNCLIVSRNDGIDLRYGPLAGGQPAAPLVAEHLTISATNSGIHLRSTNREPGQPVHRLYMEDCVFAPPVTSKSDLKAPAVISAFDPDADLAGVEWWGLSNGVSPEIPAMIRADHDRKPDPAKSGLDRWKSIWPREQQDRRLLSGPGGVVMTEQFSSKPGTIKPSQFLLHTNAKAARWTEGNKPIGVDIRAFDPPVSAAKPKDSGSKDAKAAPATKPKVNQPDF